MSEVSDVEKQYRLVYAVTQHPLLGFLIEAFLVELNDDGSFSMKTGKVGNLAKLHSLKIPYSEIDEFIISQAEKFSEEKLAARFNKKSKKFSDFEKLLKPDFLNKTIRPYIEEKLLKILETLCNERIPVYFKGTRINYIKDKALKIPEKDTTVVFNFRAGEHHLTYYQTIKTGDEQISLFGKEPIVLCQKPVWLILDKTLHHFEPEIDFNKLKPFFTNEFILIRKEAQDEYFKKFILKSVRKFEVNPVGFEIEEWEGKPEVVLKIIDNWQKNKRFRLEFHYPSKIFTLNEKADCFVEMKTDGEQYHFIKYLRDIDFENHTADFLISLGLIRDYNNDFTLPDGHEDYDCIVWVNQHAQELKKQGIKTDLGKLSNFYSGPVEIKFQQSKKMDWFDISVKLCLEGYEIPFIRLRNNLLRFDRLFELPDGKIVVLPEVWFEKYRDLVIFGSVKNNRIKIRKQFVRTGGKEKHKDLHISREEIRKLTDVVPEAGLIEEKLRPYQLEGFRWMYFMTQRELGCCLADDMGLGKTIQTLALLEKKKAENKTGNDEYVQLDLFSFSEATRKTSLVVMPTSLLYNWAAEIKKFAPHLRCYLHEGMNRRRSTRLFHQYDLILTSYGLVRNDLDFLKNFSFYYLILDESQFIKNPESKIFQSVVQLKAEHRIVLTGTPIENSLSDLWAQMDFLNPGILGSLEFFRNEYIIPIEKNNDQKKAERLKIIIAPFILRRKKTEVAAELPSLTENIHYCEMTEEQQLYYERKKSQIRNYLLSEVNSQNYKSKMLAVLKALMQLRLISNHPVLDSPDYNFSSGKFDEVIRNVEDVLSENHKILIFSSFVRHLKLFEAYFRDNSVPFKMLTGSTPSHLRKGIINDFQNNNAVKLFLISIKAGGFGLNLTAADYVFILDPWWNPAVEFQAINRSHRIGQDKKVFSYKFITKGSVEEKILILQQHKKELADAFLNEANPLRMLSMEEIEGLFE
ncbi:MAG TPA: DEAD/DEAH box helicase [Bacteroidia bacterium]|nr:DEAD/DEAH box helicase [Bacteroidia bacterium]HRS59392.1 DEAD/DEAH box helicase [Bacteroidia bacterium]HRU68727.1 DEAD/DEAH box helicase [Bacteroidia bacterium]